MTDSQERVVELKACPFCGREPDVEHEGFNCATIVRCTYCRLRLIDSTDRKAFKLWNTRTPPEAFIPTEVMVDRVARAGNALRFYASNGRSGLINDEIKEWESALSDLDAALAKARP